MVVDVQAQQVTFSWSPPLSPNGNIIGYTLSYFNTTQNITHPDALVADQRMVTVENLNEFTLYRFELRATTVAGSGEPAVEILRTNETGK